MKALPVESPRLGDRSYRIGSGWVASHVWQFTVDGVRATLDATTNSFIPNMVWLPRSLARLSDVQGSPLQAHLIAVARQLYGAVELRARLKQIVEATWARLPGPWGPVRRPLGPLNFFEVDDGWVERRTQTIRTCTPRSRATRPRANGLTFDRPGIGRASRRPTASSRSPSAAGSRTTCARSTNKPAREPAGGRQRSGRSASGSALGSGPVSPSARESTGMASAALSPSAAAPAGRDLDGFDGDDGALAATGPDFDGVAAVGDDISAVPVAANAPAIGAAP